MGTYAWLVVNGFIHTQKFQEIFDWLIRAAARQDCELELWTNTELLPRLVMSGDGAAVAGRAPQFVLFWDKDVRLARLLERAGLTLFNSARAVAVCDDKAATFLELLGSGIRIPRTVIAPKTFCPDGFPDLGFLQETEEAVGYPMVLKECYGSFGQQVYLVHDRAGLKRQLAQIGNRPCLFQEYIAASAGRDVRVQMVGEEAVAAMRRYNDHDFRANVTNGGSMCAHEPTKEELDMARLVMRTLRLDFAGVDILSGADGKPVLCEVNSNAHFVNIYQCTGVNTADAIVRYCLGRIGGMAT